MPIRLIVVDDEPKIREAWKALVATTDDIVTSASLASADRLCDEVRTLQSDVVLLDLKMPGKDPLVALAETIAARPDTRVVVYTALTDVRLRRMAIEAGACAYADKLDDLSTVLDTIRRVARTPAATGQRPNQPDAGSRPKG